MLAGMRIVILLGLTAFALSSCGGLPLGQDNPPVQGLAGDQAGVNGEGAPLAPENTAAPKARAAAPADDATQALPAEGAGAEPARNGFFGALFGGGRTAAPGEGKPRLFGAAFAAPGPVESTPEVTKGTVLPFGEVATICGLGKQDLGDAVAQSHNDGSARWQLHDPIPASTGARTQYVTGFRDRCARQVTGALVLFGAANVHEATRYDSGNTRPYSATDTAYEKVKSRICGVRANVPCPADRIARLNKAVSFVTVYPRFGTTSEWFELLLVDGQLSASGITGR